MDGAHIIAGGTDLIDRMKCGLVVKDIVTVCHFEALRSIVWEGDDLRIGAAVTHHHFATNELVTPSLRAVWATIANMRIRSRGTIGGNLMAGVPSYEGTALLAACGAIARMINMDGKSCAVSVADICTQRGMLIDVTIPKARQLSLRANRSFRHHLLIAIGQRPGEPGLIALGGLAIKPILLRSNNVSNFHHDGPHGEYIARLASTLVRRLQYD
jgi:aerobic carbon-monoxide dehydrogenase medium subunit